MWYTIRSLVVALRCSDCVAAPQNPGAIGPGLKFARGVRPENGRAWSVPYYEYRQL